MPADLNAKVYDVLDAGIGAVDLAYKSGVKMAYGTDLLGVMHRHQLSEFALRGEAVKPADLVRMTDRIGRIEHGFLADVIVVDGNPLEDIGVLQDPPRYLKAVMKEGIFYKNELET